MTADSASDSTKHNEIIIYTGPGGNVRVQMRFTGDDLWMSQQQMGQLFGVTRENVNIHLVNIYSEGELAREATCKESLQVRMEGARRVERPLLLYNLDAIISVGYRVSSKEATRFRIWATRIVKEYAVKGHVVDVERLKDPDASDYFQELLEKVRDIRASEMHVWKRILELASLCNDYTPEVLPNDPEHAALGCRARHCSRDHSCAQPARSCGSTRREFGLSERSAAKPHCATSKKLPERSARRVSPSRSPRSESNPAAGVCLSGTFVDTSKGHR
jgi:hypothetical protein